MALKGKSQLTGQDIETGPRNWALAKHADGTYHNDAVHQDHSDVVHSDYYDSGKNFSDHGDSYGHSDHSDIAHSDDTSHSDKARFR
jgi:hypothetical protein